jgi:hypothetical protein
MKRALAIVAAMATAGCFSISERIAPYRDQHVTKITGRLGPPATEFRVAGQHWYTWTLDRSMAGFGSQPIQGQCKLSAMVDAEEIVRTIQWEGNNIGCGNLMSALK